MTDSTDSNDKQRKRGRALNPSCIYVYLYPHDRETLKQLAAEQNRTMAAQARHFVELALRKHQPTG